MQDILITPKGKTKVLAIAQTERAKNIFKQNNAESGLEGHKKQLASLLAWAVSCNLSVDSKVPIIIQPLLAQYYPKFEINLGKGFEKIDEEIENSKKNLEHLQAIDSFAKKQKQLLFRYFSLPVADGKAFYQITKVTKTKATVILCDGICLDNYADAVLGEEAIIPLAQAEQFVASRDAMEKLFS